MTRETGYALVALTHLSEHGGARPQPVSARDVAQTYGLSQALTMKVLKRLHQAQIIDSTRGAHGGYRLAVAPTALSLTRVITAIEGPVKVAACCGEPADGSPPPCSVTLRCPITSSVRRLNHQIVGLLGQYTLADFMKGQPLGGAAAEGSTK